RLKVASAWSLDLFLPPELVQLNVSSGGGFSQEHFEPGQNVFRQGELGDRVYIILRGEADVVCEADGVETTLARLRAGEYFGEMALLNKTTRSATVRCVTQMDTLSLPKGEFTTLTANLPELRQSFETVMERRKQETSRRMGSGQG